MNILVWIIVIALVSLFWAFIALRKEKNKKELNEAQKDISKGRVIYHSSDDSSVSSSS